MIDFIHEGIDPIYRDGEWYVSTIAKDKRMEGEYGDTPNNPLWRNQWASKYRYGYANRMSFEFSLMFKENTIGAMTVCGLHSTNGAESLFNIMQDGEKLCLSFNGDNVSDDYIVPNEEIRFKVDIYNRNAEDGYIRVCRNGVLAHEYIGDMSIDSDEKWYFKIGCYIWLSPPHRPEETQWDKHYKQVYFQI